MTTDCPICQETVKTFVTLECEHKICLACYHQCIKHSHNKCSLCRAEIKEIDETIEVIESLSEDVVDLTEELNNADLRLDIQDIYIKELEKAIELLEEERELIEYGDRLDINGEMAAERSFNMMYQE